MSENKNGQGAQWSKGAATPTAATAAAQKQHESIYNAALSLSPSGTSSSTASALYSGTGHLGGHQPSDVATYAAARFQAPPIDHRTASSSSHIVPQTPSSTTNVPVPSGFIPPPFPAAAAGATSVLTPNPYAVAHTSTNHPLSHPHPHPHQAQQFPGAHGHFGMEQFQHLNAQQQYELSKLMANSFSSTQQTSVGLSGPTNLASNPTSSSSSTSVSNAPTGIGHVTPSRHANSHPVTASENSTSGGISTQMVDQVISAISSGSSATKLATTPIHGRLMGLGVHAPDEDKLRRIQQVVESGIGDQSKQQIVQILDRISTLRPVEKLLLYLRLPGEQPETDPLRQPQNPLGTRSEINHTINWVRTHLEQDPQVSIPKQDVYNDYLIYCERLDIKPLSTADFGKVMKQVFPGIRPRRLGTRGHSRYCYAAMRKTSKLPAPHLPTLMTTKTTKSGEKDGGLDLSTNIIDSTEEQEEAWSVIKQWAETILRMKIDNMRDLATHIKTNGPLPLVSGTHTPYTGTGRGAGAGVMHKKHLQREPKEKRVLADMGPLKKRRKKKRKGSSSSESSCHQNEKVGDQQQSQPLLSPANSSKSSHQAVLSPGTDDGQKVKIKQEIIDSPGYPLSVGSLSTHSQSTDSANVTQYQTNTTAPMQQHQVMPMNLAAETRGGVPNVLVRATPVTATVTASAFEHVRPIGVTTSVTAVKNLTPKILELSTDTNSISTSPSHTIIKQEIGADDYNTSNIFCKKVRKAQQTKGFLANSPTSNRISTLLTPSAVNLPIITTTASTPPPMPASVITAPPNNNIDGTVVYNMGPPTQMAPSTSPSNHTLNDDGTSLGQPKVLSRNLQQLKAKKLLAVAAATNCDPPDLSAAKDAADLPENLGLPRERVISICNMDKHELDDYFLPVEEENSEDQETELLQYFQIGDAEEKLNKNSSSDAKRNSNSTVNQLTSTVTSTTTSKSTTTTTIATTSAALTLNTITSTSKASAIMMMNTFKSSCSTSISDINSQLQNNFLPISPNINTTSTSNTSTLLSNATNAGCFASPGLSRLLTKQQSLDCDTSSDPMIGATRRHRSYTSMMTSASAPPSPSILKQQHEQQQLFGISHNLLMDQWSHAVGPFNNPTASNNTGAPLMVEQNSLDLDLFGEAVAEAASMPTNTDIENRNNYNKNVNNISEGPINHSDGGQVADVTQRSQSVPLSQLQRSHTPTFNRSFHCNINNPTAVSACNSLAQTPVPSEFIDSVTMLSENSCSQQSASMKLDEVVNVVASDSTAILDDVDVSEILSSPDFVTKLSGLNQSGTTKTTCSSAGSSSGYSSAGHFSLSSGSYSSGIGNGGGSAVSSTISRSVPSTPLPHQNPQSQFGNSNNFYRRRFVNKCQSLNDGGVLDSLNFFTSNFSSCGKYGYGYMNSSLSRSACDISKSMPSTPITTTPSSFRYSPSEFTRDFLINGNTIDESITSSFGAVANENLMGSDVVGVDAPLNAESLLNEEDTLINGSTGISRVDVGVLTPNFAVRSESATTGLRAVVEQAKRKRLKKKQKSQDSILEEPSEMCRTPIEDHDDVNTSAVGLLLAEVVCIHYHATISLTTNAYTYTYNQSVSNV
ncbi:hypothetical protein DOY81_008678 [Sarcophaga bullata]|nr:hypothetical protein DOY81_008678 [Sarcophaga bullata]